MTVCPICERSVVRVASHLRKVHHVYHKTNEPKTLKEYIQLLKLFNVSPSDWDYIRKHHRQLTRFYKEDQKLPGKVFQTLYMNFEKYRASKGPKLVILDGVMPFQKTTTIKNENKSRSSKLKPIRIIDKDNEEQIIEEGEPAGSKQKEQDV